MHTQPAIKYFTEKRVVALTGLSRRRLRYWNETGFFRPEYQGGDPSRVAVYSFRDVVALRAIAALRSRVPLQELRRVGEYLATHHDSPWSSLKFIAVEGKVYFFDPDAEKWLGLPDQQVAIREAIVMDRVLEETVAAVEQLRRRPREAMGRIVRSPSILGKAPVIEGTRITTAAIWSFHEDGYSTTAILAQYPTLTEKDVVAAIEYEQAQRDSKKTA